MVVDGSIAEIAAALCAGAGVAWWSAHRLLTRRFDGKLRRIVELHRKQHEVVVDRLNAAHAQLRKEMEQQRPPAPRRDAAASDRSAVKRLEEQLKTAYAELDRLRLEVKGPAPVGMPKMPNGFADTQPFEHRRPALQR